VRLTVLGCSGTYPRPGEACNGFLLQEGGFNLVLDLGNGCMSNLMKAANYTEIHAVIVSHMHVDHFLDLYPLFYALRFDLGRPWELPLYAPPDALGLMGSLLSEDSSSYLGRVFRHQPVQAGDSLELPGMRISFHPAVHPVDACSIRIEGAGWTLAYSGDTSGGDGLQEAAAGSDLFICEATMINSFAEHAIGHLTSQGAAEAAQRAGAGKLLLTHIWPTFDRQVSLAEASEAFGGEVELAAQDMTIEL
jgi:ribonuclease BN (tRNA processing enzyme)